MRPCLLRQQLFGYTHEDLRIIMAPMAKNGEEAIGSMGTDTPLAVLSDRAPILFNYFKQLFAQVTNPPLDAIREELVTSMSTALGPERNLLEPEPESCRMIKINSPVLNNDDLAKLRHMKHPGFKTVTLPMKFNVAEGGAGLRRAMDDLCAAASYAITDGATILILSDRGMDKHHRSDSQPAGHIRRPSPPGARRHADESHADSWKPARRVKCIISAC